MKDSTTQHSHPRHRPFTAPAGQRWHPTDAATGEDTAAYTQGALALTYPIPGGLEAVPRPGALTLVSGEGWTGIDLPDAEAWAARFVQAVVEVVSSDRPLSQLARWTDPGVYDDLSRRRDRVASHRRPGQQRVGRQQVATVHVRQSTADSAEVAARVTLGGRSRAIAARLDFRRDRWLCTALTFDGLAPVTESRRRAQ